MGTRKCIELSKSLRDWWKFTFCNNDILPLEKINLDYGISRLLSHEETGNSWSYQRDKLVQNWCRNQGIDWIEYPTNGVIRKLKDRDLWKRKRDARMRENLYEPPEITNHAEFDGDAPSMIALGLNPRKLTNYPVPGQSAALRRLETFLNEEAKQFQWAISSPTLQ